MNRDDFPILSRKVYGKPLIYLDNAATTQKPRCVVDAIVNEYYSVNANVHRGVHYLSQQATDLHEAARETVRQFINARKIEEIIFTRGTTESINLIASSMGKYLQSNQRPHHQPNCIVTTLEHHSNIVPWQLNGFEVRAIPVSNDGELDMEAYSRLFDDDTRMVSVTYASNVLGMVTPVSEIIRIAHERGVPVLIDGAQSTPHFAVDMQKLDCDFYVFSGHKVYGPTGIGVLYGKEHWLDRLPPYQGGGEMIKRVSFALTTYERLPFKFEAGTPDYIASTSLAKGLDYIGQIGLDAICAHEQDLTRYAVSRLQEIEGIRIYGRPTNSVVSFNLRDIHHLDVGTLLDRLGIAVRTGHHCAQPLMERLGVEGTVRASFALYNTKDEIDTLIAGLQRVAQMF